jgi:hypothetical protein
VRSERQSTSDQQSTMGEYNNNSLSSSVNGTLE